MECRYSQLDIAITQLNAAIRLFLDDKDYISSATLAGASEEIVGAMLRRNGEDAALDVDSVHLLT